MVALGGIAAELVVSSIFGITVFFIINCKGSFFIFDGFKALYLCNRPGQVGIVIVDGILPVDCSLWQSQTEATQFHFFIAGSIFRGLRWRFYLEAREDIFKIFDRDDLIPLLALFETN